VSRIPAGSKITKVEGFAHELKDPDWLPCDGKECLGHKVAAPEARAMFEQSGHQEKTLANGVQVCWGFRNWSSDKKREAILRVTYRRPSK
jgi:hypothetical protein